MKFRVQWPGQVPYGGGYKIERPDLGMVGMGTTFEMLERNVRKYRRDNAIPIGLGFSEELEQHICQAYPQECEMSNEVLPLKRNLGMDDVVRGTEVLAALKIRLGGQLVPHAEAIRRGNTCDRCPMCKPFPTPCSGLCGAIKGLADQIIGGSYGTPWDGDKRACGICRCFMSSHIRVPYAALEVGLDADMKAQFQEAAKEFSCWKIPGAM